MPTKPNKTNGLQFGKIYHIFNKALGSELLFSSEKDYHFFLQKLKRFITPYARIFSYCLIPNHFHLLIQAKEEEEISFKSHSLKNLDNEKIFTQKFSDLFNSYSKSYNKAYDRKGRLFLYSFKHIEVIREDYLVYLICYIHRNPIHHGLTFNYEDWKYSSYNTFLSNKPTQIEREYILDIFGSRNEFVNFHNLNKTKRGLKEFIIE
jgi:REP element-mobilizing transposase RayT